ncbi:hypothetical protein [Paraburkholderia eburnea]|nr:hypothetical protein [Paraburkholderia eburnea]
MQAALASAPAASAAEDSAQQACPQCATVRVAGKRFCRQCRFDFAALDNASPSIESIDAAPLQQAAPEPIEAVREMVSPVVTQAAEPELATIDTPVSPATQPHTPLDAAPAEQAFAATAPATPLASDAEAVEHCPQCASARTPGKRFCRTCRFDFTVSKQIDEIPAEPPVTVGEPIETLAEVATSPVSEAPLSTPTQTADVRADDATIAARYTASTTPSAPADTAAPAMPEQPAEAPRENGFGASSATAQSPDVPAPKTADTDRQTTAATSAASSAEESDGKKKWIIGGIAVVVVGVAVGAGLMLRSHHAPATSADTVASAPVAASAPPFVDAASQAPAATPASVPAPSLAAALNEPSSGAQADAASETSAPSSGATIVDTGSQTQAQPQTPAQTQPQAEPQASAPQAQTQPPAPAQNAVPEPAAPAPHVREKPKKSAAPADANANSSENATIRAAIAGNLADGNGCFSNKKFDCAISNADAVLRLDPHNAQALSLRKRARAAQQSALNSMSIE